MKKVLVLALAMVFLFGLAAQAASPDFAKAEKNQKHFQFKDVKGHWAEKVVEEMSQKGYLKGYQDGTFKPKNVVSNLEAIVILVRAADLEDEAEDASLDTFKHSNQIPAWAQGYVAVAIEEGILLEDEMDSFRPNQPAKRAEVALWISRAFELDEVFDTSIQLKFADKKDIPEKLQNKVAVVFRAGFMKGTPNNCFLPNKPLTRAEMAALLDNIDKTPYIWLKSVNGFLEEIDEDDNTITIKKLNWTDEKVYDLADDVTVYLDGKIIDDDPIDVLADCDEKLHVRLFFNPDGDVYFIRAKTCDEEDEENNDLGDLEDELNEKWSDYEDVVFDINLRGDEDDISVRIYVDLDEYDEEWDDLDESDIEDYLQDIVDDILDVFDDADISGKIADSAQPTRPLILFTVNSNDNVVVGDLDEVLSDLEDELNDEFSEMGDIDDLEIVLDGSWDELTIKVRIDYSDFEDEWEDLTDSEIEDYLDDIRDYILDQDRFDDAEISAEIYDTDENASMGTYDYDDDFERDSDYS